MKTLHLASIFVLAAATTFACNDDEDRVSAGTAGSSGAAGKSGSAGNPSAGEDNAAAGMNTAGTSEAGAGGASAGAGNDGGVGGGGAGGENQGGAFDGGGAGSGGAGGDGGAGGAPEVPDVVVAGPTELIGTWSTDFSPQVITANTWNGANIVAYTSGVTVVYTHNPASAPYNPKKFSKFVYTQPVNDSFYFCQIVYDAETLAAAQADTKVADATTPATSGCSSFPWTKATKQ